MFNDDEDSRDEVENLPLFIKGKEILDYVLLIADMIPEDDNVLQSFKEMMIEDASNLIVKVAGAHNAELYDIKMEAAVIIRKSAQSLMVQYHSLTMFDFADAKYFEVIRELLEEYRILFIDWIAQFDQWNYVIDRWGLFNPPGVGPFDKDPDEDIPFDPDI